MIKKYRFLILSSLILLALVSLFLLWNILNQKLSPENDIAKGGEEKTEVDSTVPISQRISFEQVSEPGRIFSEESGLNVPTFPLPQPKMDMITESEGFLPKSIAFFENIKKAALSAQEIVEKKASAPTSSSPGALSSVLPEISSQEIKLTLTDEEFNYLYPEIFLKDLKNAQSLLKEYDPTYEPIPEIKNDSHVRYVQEKIVLALLSAQMINKVEAERFVTTIRFTLPQIQSFELEQRKQALNKRSLAQTIKDYIKNVFSESKQISQGLYVAGLTQRLQNILLPTAEAGGGGGGGPCGECHPLPFCFQEGLSPLPIPGPAFFKPSCQCTGCLFGQGCLDFCVGRAALYDPISGICGCGM